MFYNIRNLVIIDFLSSSGVRIGELINLNIEDINFENKSCIVFGIPKLIQHFIMLWLIKIMYQLNDLMLEDRKIEIWSYNIETIIAEKFESIVKRGILGTRVRDYYDVYMLLIHKVKATKKVKETLTDENLEKLRDTCSNVRDIAIL